MSRQSQAWYLSERATQLAIMLLTRVPGVSVTREIDTSAVVDLLVDVGRRHAKPNVEGRALFGIVLKATTTPRRVVRADGLIAKIVGNQLLNLTDQPDFPIGVLVCDVAGEAAYFGWLSAPEIYKGKALTKRYAQIRTEFVRSDTMIGIVADVRRWYEHRA